VFTFLAWVVKKICIYMVELKKIFFRFLYKRSLLGINCVNVLRFSKIEKKRICYDMFKIFLVDLCRFFFIWYLL